MKRIATLVMSLALLIGCGLPEPTIPMPGSSAEPLVASDTAALNAQTVYGKTAQAKVEQAPIAFVSSADDDDSSRLSDTLNKVGNPESSASCGTPILFPCGPGLNTCNVLCCSGAHVATDRVDCGGCQNWGKGICGSGLRAAWWTP